MECNVPNSQMTLRLHVSAVYIYLDLLMQDVGANDQGKVLLCHQVSSFLWRKSITAAIVPVSG